MELSRVGIVIVNRLYFDIFNPSLTFISSWYFLCWMLFLDQPPLHISVQLCRALTQRLLLECDVTGEEGLSCTTEDIILVIILKLVQNLLRMT